MLRSLLLPLLPLLCSRVAAHAQRSAPAQDGCAVPDFSGSTLEDVVQLGHRLGIENPQLVMDRSKTANVSVSNAEVNLLIHHHEGDQDIPTLLREVRTDRYKLAGSPAGSLLDIGGHIGACAILFALIHAGSHVHTFEPTRLNFFYLAWNAVTNGVTDRVFLYNAGLSADGQNFTVNFSPQGSMRSASASLGTYDISRATPRTVHETYSARTVALPELLQRGCFNDVTNVKLDCEGCEFTIVPAAPDFFTDMSKNLFGEYHARHIVILAKTHMPAHVLQQTWQVLCNRTDWEHIEWLSCFTGLRIMKPWLADPNSVRRRRAANNATKHKQDLLK